MPAPLSAVVALRSLGRRALRPTYNIETSRWRKPVVSPRVAAKVRKEALRTGDVGRGKMWDHVWEIDEGKIARIRVRRKTIFIFFLNLYIYYLKELP